MVDYIAGSTEIPSGKYALMDVEIYGYSLESNKIVGIADISEAEITFEIEDGKHNDIAEPTVVTKY